MIETKVQFARRLGVHKSSITRAAQAGRVILTADGRVDVERSIERWYATRGGRTDVAARHAANRGEDGPRPHPAAENPPKTPRDPSAPQPDATEQPADGNRTRYKALVLHYENQSIKLEMALRRGLRYPLALVRKEAQSLGATIRAAMERIIDQTAPRLAVMDNDLDRRRLLEAELARLRWMVKTELPRALRRMRKAGQGAGTE